MAQQAQKKSISFFPEDLSRIEAFPSSTYGEKLSGKVQEIIQDMHYAMLRTRQEVESLFSEAEWMYLRDMLNGSLTSPQISYKVYLTAQVEDADTYDGLGAKWEVDVPALRAKVDALTEFQAYTVTKMVHAWWNEQAGRHYEKAKD